MSFVENPAVAASNTGGSVLWFCFLNKLMEVRMIGRTLALICASALVPVAAHAASMTVIGNNPAARECFLAADSDRVRPDAQALCTRALDSGSLRYRDQVATLVNRGVIRFRASQFDGAVADFDAVLARDANQPDALINKGITMLASGGDIDSAVRLLDRGLQGNPQRPWVGYYGRAVANELAGRDTQAYNDYRQAKLLRPEWKLASDALARFN